jgi:hypothetical protein
MERASMHGRPSLELVKTTRKAWELMLLALNLEKLDRPSFPRDSIGMKKYIYI